MRGRIALGVAAALALSAGPAADGRAQGTAPAAPRGGAENQAQSQTTGAAGARPTAAEADWFTSPTRFGQRDGASLYAAVCAGCHMPDGRGAVGAGRFPALANNERLEAAGYPLSVVANGLRGMPAVGRQMSDEQVAAVVAWVRTNLGNAYREPVTAEDARAARDPS